MGRKTKTSIIMVDGSFRESFHSVDFFCRQTLPPENYELIWVEYYDQIHSVLEKKISQYPNARLLKLKKKGEYHSSFCFNEGIKESRGEILFIPDGDVAVDVDFLEKALIEHEICSNLALYFHRKEEPEKYHKADIDLNHLKKVCVLSNADNFGGCLSIKKKWLIDINGYDQHPVFGSGFHANGMDVYTRLKNIGLHVMWHPDFYLYHPWHSLSRVAASNYDLQHVIIQHRVLKLEAKTYQGINPANNIPISPELLMKMQIKKRISLAKVLKRKLRVFSKK